MSDTARQQNHTAWLIELGSSPASSPLYYTGWDWRPDIVNAAAFPSRGAAQTIARSLGCDVRVNSAERCETGWVKRVNVVSVEQGDIVMLNSGGPEMTIDYIKNGQAFCTWYIDATHKAGASPGHGHPPHAVRVEIFPLPALTLIAKRIPQELGGHDDRVHVASAPSGGLAGGNWRPVSGVEHTARGDLEIHLQHEGLRPASDPDFDLLAGTPAAIARIASIALTAFNPDVAPWEHLSPAQRARRISDVAEIIDNAEAGPYPTPWHRMAHAVVHGFTGDTPDPVELNDYGRPVEPNGIQMDPRRGEMNRFFKGEIVECREVQGNCLLRFEKRFTAPDGEAVNVLYLDPQDRSHIGDGSCYAPDSELNSIGQLRFFVLRAGAAPHRIVEVIAGDSEATDGTIYRVVTTIEDAADAVAICEGLELQYRQVQAKINACGLAGSDQQLAAA